MNTSLQVHKMLNKSKGDMYKFVDYTWNPIKGKCIHNCSYCYMKRFPLPEIHLDEKELKTDLGKGHKIFVGSSTDMFAENVPDEWIKKVINYCKNYMENTYYFQSKNPSRFIEFRDELIMLNCILGTTTETNRNSNQEIFSQAPEVETRFRAMRTIHGFRKFITIEPIMSFDINQLVGNIQEVQPDFVNIGADSKNHHLPEPIYEEVMELKKELEKFTIVNLKDNLKRLRGK